MASMSTTEKFDEVYPVLFSIIGSILNAISLVIYSQKSFRCTSMGTYLIVYCTTITILLYVNLYDVVPSGQQRVNSSNDNNDDGGLEYPRNSVSACKLYKYLYFSLSQFSSWILVLISCDRLFLVFYPKYKFTGKRSFQVCALAVLLVSLLVFNTPAVIYTAFAIENNRYECLLLYKVDEYRSILMIYNILDSLIFSIVPFFIMLTSSILMILRLHSLGKLKSSKNAKSKDSHLAFVVITIDAMFLVFNLPICITGALYLYYEYWGGGTEITLKGLKDADIYSEMLVYLHYILHFFISMAFNRIFRTEFKKLLFGIRQLLRSNAISQSTEVTTSKK